MNFKKILLPLLMVAFSISIISCANNSSEKNEGTESKQHEAMESTSTDTASLHSPDTASIQIPSPGGKIAIDKLPTGVNEFVTKNYPGYQIKSAASDPLCQGGDAIDLAITKSGAPNLSLIFRPNGQFVQQEEDVSLATAPQKISDALKTKYSGYAADKQIEKLILADKTVQYLVDLTKGKLSKEVIFSAEGNVACEGK
ncbi:MAG: hypothetical protein M3Z92_07165 [Bacteroidota bacterium]|nr:hypothetical protein [Bacteroidota bacterium]MDQ6904029.1 hypothetical protein [Bacteroidota bacterium]